MTFEEVKELFKKSIDTTDTMNQAIENFIQSIYLKGYNDAFESKWIPVSERLPKKEGRYLVTCKIGFSLNEDIENDETVDIAFYKDGHWSKYILYEDIYAWMPLPEKPYKAIPTSEEVAKND